MKKRRMSWAMVACGLALVASAAYAGKAEIETKASETIIDTLSFRHVSVDKALDTIAAKSGIAIKKVNIPKDVPLVTFEAKSISALEAVKIVTVVAQLKYVIVDDGIEVSGMKKD